MSRSRPDRTLVVALVSCGLLFVACAGMRRGGGPVRLVARWSDEPPAGLLDAEALAALQTPDSWSFESPDERERWSLRGLAALGVEGSSWRLGVEGSPTRLSRAANLSADAISAVVLRASESVVGRARLYWSGARGTFGRQRSVATTARPGDTQWRFEMMSQEDWVGTIQGLRFDLPTRSGGEIGLAGVEFVPAQDALARLVAKTWSVTLEAETRAALVVPPNLPAERSWSFAPEVTTLRLAYGLLPGRNCALRADLTATVAGDSVTRALFARDLLAPQDARWHEAAVDVRELAGQTVLLRLASRLAAPCQDPAPAIVFAIPELLRVAAHGEPPTPNLVLISVDTLRADRLGVYGYPRPTSPRIDAWARNAVVFETTVAPAPWTLPSHVSMLTGMTALGHGVNYQLPAPASLPFLAEILRAHGYSTAAWTGGSWMAPRYGIAQGFDLYHAWTAPDDWDGELAAHVETAIDWLRRSAAEPFFLLFHTFETHAPYLPREPFYSRWARHAGVRGGPTRIYDRLLPPNAEEGFLLRKQLVVGRDGQAGFGASPDEKIQLGITYDSGIAYADWQLGRLLDALFEHNLEERTLVVLTSDHGESLGEEGLVSHGHLHDSNLLVPWILALPDGRAMGKRIPTQVGLIDLVPTVLDLLGLPVPGGLDGRSLVPLLRGAAPAAPRLAAAYAGSSNLGLALYAGGHRKYVLNDTPWPPLAGTDALFQTGRTAGDEHLAAETAPMDRAFLHEQALRLLARGAGLHLRIWNGETVVLGGSLQGPCIHPLTVKSVAVRPGAVAWVRRQEVSFEVLPSETIELRIDSPTSPCLALYGSLSEDDDSFRLVLDPSAGREQLFGYVRDQWISLKAGAAPRTGVHAWLEGPFIESARDPVATDAALRRQLQALGYVQ